MRTARGLAAPAALAALVALAAWPLLRLGYPTIGDGLIHFYRLVQLDHLLRAGVVYPRWAADMAYGFGYPLFNYYSPLAYYVGALLHGLGLSYANALLGVYMVGLALALTGAYSLAAEWWGQAAGLAAAAAYGLAPYFYFNALARGALPETVGLGLLPWVLWAYARLARRATPGRLVLTALLNAALVLTHLLSALLGAALIVVVVLFEVGSRQKAEGGKQKAVSRKQKAGSRKQEADSASLKAPNRLARVSSALANYQLPIAAYLLSLGLAAFFLIPAALELGAVQTGQLTTPGDLDFHNNFLAFTELLAWPRAYDARLVFNAVPPSLSVAALALALAGGVVSQGQALRGRTVVRRVSREWLLVLALLVMGALTLPVSVGVWERLPLLGLIQFPWRLVGPASLLLALLAGLGVGRLAEAGWAQRRGVAALSLCAALALVWVNSLAWSYGPASQAPAAASLADLHAYERDTGQLGTTSTGEFLPRAVRTLPDPYALDAAYAGGRPTARLADLPAGVTVLSQTASATGAAAEVEAATATTLTFNVFDFPGWRATIDGQPATITASDPHGLITVPVPAGQHHIAIRFGATPLRAGASVVSLLALVGLVVIAPGRRRRSAVSGPNPPVPFPQREPSPPGYEGRWGALSLAFGLTAILMLLTRIALLDGRPTPFARSRFDGATVAGAAQALDVNFDDQLVLIGWDGAPASVAADETVPLTLYWRAQNVPSADYSTTVQVLDAEGHLFGQSDSQHPGRVPTSRWRTDQYAQDAHPLQLLPGTPPGTYRLVAGVYQVDGPALAVLSADYVPQGQVAELGTLTVTAARRPAVPDPAQPLEVGLGPLRLLGYSLNTTAPQAGDEVRLTLFWRAEAGPRPDAAVRLALIGVDGAVLVETTEAPAQATHPTSAWAAGEVVRAPRRLRVPATVPAGPATLMVSLVPLEAADPPLAGPIEVAALDLRVPERTFSVPPMRQRLDAAMGAQVTLLGYALAPTGPLTLYWQALAPLEASYKVFVHALGEAEEILAQADTVPAAGTRPTTGWLPGEIVADAHALPLAGATRVAVGLYEETTGERLGRVVISLP